MKDLIQLNPLMGEVSEVRGLTDLLALLKTGNSLTRIALLKRLNLDDIETSDDLLRIMDVLTNEELGQFQALLDLPFLERILPLNDDLNFKFYLGATRKRFNQICQLITVDNVTCLIPIIEKYSLKQLRKFLDAISSKTIIDRVIRILVSRHFFMVRLNESLNQADPASFKKQPGDVSFQATHHTQFSYDDHHERCSAIVQEIDDALYFLSLLEEPQQSEYINTLLKLVEGIIHDSTALKYLFSGLSEDKQSVLMSLLIKHGISRKQRDVISKEENVFSQWQRNTFFVKEPISNQQDCINNCCFSKKQQRDIQNMINTLQKEINSIFPFPDKGRKFKKIMGLRSLLINSTTMGVIEAITQIENDYPEIRHGTISKRTAQLLDNIRGGGSIQNTVSKMAIV